MAFLDYLFHPGSLAAMAAILTFAVMKLDCKVSDEKKKVSSYCKNILLVSALVGATAYVLKTYAFKSMKGGNRTSGVIFEDVALGEPDF